MPGRGAAAGAWVPLRPAGHRSHPAATLPHSAGGYTKFHGDEMTHLRPIALLCLVCTVVGFSMLNAGASPARAHGLRAGTAPFPYRISGVKKVAQLIGPTPKSPYAP